MPQVWQPRISGTFQTQHHPRGQLWPVHPYQLCLASLHQERTRPLAVGLVVLLLSHVGTTNRTNCSQMLRSSFGQTFPWPASPLCPSCCCHHLQKQALHPWRWPSAPACFSPDNCILNTSSVHRWYIQTSCILHLLALHKSGSNSICCRHLLDLSGASQGPTGNRTRKRMQHCRQKLARSPAHPIQPWICQGTTSSIALRQA